MNLRHLAEFLAVVESGSIGTAAASLGMSQPGLSKSIRRLEQDLGVPLLQRLPRGVRPTVYGELLRDCAAAVVAETERARSEIKCVRDGISGTIRAGAGADWLFNVVPKAVAALHWKSPRVRVCIFGGFNDELRSMLTARKIDFCLATLPAVDFDPVVKHEHWITDRFRVVARREHPIHRQESVSLKDLQQYPWALPTSSPVLRQSLEALHLQHGLPAPKPAFETNYMSLCLSVLATSSYLGWVTDLQLKQGRNVGLVAVSCPEANLVRRAGLITRRGETLNPAVRAFIVELKKVCAEEFAESAVAGVSLARTDPGQPVAARVQRTKRYVSATGRV